MLRDKRRRGLCPWIESLIQSFGSEEGSSNDGRLKAYVTSVGEMSQSQAQNVEGPTSLLYLSDGAVQIPAILSSSTWERLQEEGEMEYFSSLINSTVSFRKYKLRFHMALEFTKCMFFLSVGDLLILSVGPDKNIAPCYITLPSVRQKIFTTWRTLLAQGTRESQNDHDVFDLSELLGEWQDETLKSVLADVRSQLMAKSAGLQCYTSIGLPIVAQPAKFAPTGWDIERGRDNERECLSIPIKCFLISEGQAVQEQRPNAESLRMDGGKHLDLSTSESPKNRKIQNCGNNVTHEADTCVHMRKQDTIQDQMSNVESLRMDGGKQLNLSTSQSPQNRKIENCGKNFTHQGERHVDLRKQDTIQKQMSDVESWRMDGSEQLNLSTSESPQNREIENCGKNVTHQCDTRVDLRKQDSIREEMSNAESWRMDEGEQLNLSTSESPQNRDIEICGNNFTHQVETCVDLRKQSAIHLDKPWQMFNLPKGSCSSISSQDSSPLKSLQTHRINCDKKIASTHLPIMGTQPKDLQHSKGNPSSLPPYQELPFLSDSSNTPTPNGPTAPQEKQTSLENVEMPQETVSLKAKRKKECIQEAQTAVEEEGAQMNGSPPSWLFDTVTESGTVEGDIRALCGNKRKIPAVHVDGMPFSYSYVPSGQNFQDFSHFKIPKSLWDWTIGYLFPPKMKKS
ncbi:adrenocortical dysplasia protein homolog [Stigmatopora argus]